MSLQRELETFVAVDQSIQQDLARKAHVDHVRRTQDVEMQRAAYDIEQRRRTESFEFERRRAHSRPVVHETFVERRVEPTPADYRLAARSANYIREGSPVRTPLVGSRVAWKRPDDRSFTSAHTAATRKDLKKDAGDKKVQFEKA